MSTRAFRAARALRGPHMAPRVVARFLSADTAEQDLLPCRVPLVGLVSGTFVSDDGLTQLSLQSQDVSPIGSMVTKRALLQQVGSALTMPNPLR